ncbi:MAG: TatD family hydrolase [Gammaproteobacteria bacterium]|nr:TatD family hydrolase [Gammaproteobacteria bacterium]
MLLAFFKTTLLALAFSIPAKAAGSAYFDAHLHYNAEQTEYVKPQDVIKKLKQHNISYAAVTSRPPSLVSRLHQLAPDTIVPVLGIYQTHKDKINWPHDATLIQRLETALKQKIWRGIGELHITAKDRHSPVFHRIIKLASQHRLPLILHADPAVIDTVYQLVAEQPVIWAHAGTFPYPDLIADYLSRYPQLHVDLSVRDHRIAPNGVINDSWYDLFNQFPDRFMTGVDTYSVNRWQNLGAVTASMRHWFEQLPADVAQNIQYKNAKRIYKP